MKIGDQIHIKEGLEARHTRTMNVVIVENLVLEEGATMGEEALDMTKKAGSIVIIEEVLPALRLLMTGAERIGLEMGRGMKNVECLMEI